jgi:beta-lactamase regulating signal transducer with metallopeptidase domain
LADPAKARLLKAALAHEYAHIARRDMWLFVVSEIALVPLSFHPFTVLLRRRLAESREMACDERVIDEGMDPFEYARCLLAIGVDAVGATSPVGALGAGSSGLERRIAAIIAPRREAALEPGLRGWIAVVVCAAFCSTIVAEGSRSVFLWVSAVPAPPMVALRPPIPPPPPPPPPQLVRSDLR